ncbi:hypothetical protein H1W37_19030 [Stappia taiwanensis]|uniref:Uncharacterized protein n=1 Tax=Stappia taiwanensis TaxID=992267 RepID=A0A838XZ87_9HYPH|nr:hypothetical protein [Stappia taiwanensis]MBA4613756.1 hypothetical protein [Stappia taiwanensis]GGE93599.1 hypothetical protein GCM10007285_21530 [Stappia taiwanensis]
MSKPPSDSPSPPDGRQASASKEDARARRLAEALRANLRRRKSAQKPGASKNQTADD